MAVARRAARNRHPQKQCVHRPLRLVPKILPATSNNVHDELIPQKFLFGTDYPMLSPQRWLQDFRNIGYERRNQSHDSKRQRKETVESKMSRFFPE